MLKVNVLFTLLGLGGVVATCFSSSSETAAKRTINWVEWLNKNKQECYEWMPYGTNTDGKLLACLDKNAKKKENFFPLVFYLWWLKAGDKHRGKFLLIEKIQWTKQGDDITFVFKNSQNNNPVKKLKITAERPEFKNNLEILNDQTLRNICQLSASSQLQCNPTGNNGITYSSYVRKLDAWFEMRS